MAKEQTPAPILNKAQANNLGGLREKVQQKKNELDSLRDRIDGIRSDAESDYDPAKGEDGEPVDFDDTDAAQALQAGLDSLEEADDHLDQALGAIDDALGG